MENSPLRFLDYDVSLMLADEVRISQEEEARRFHFDIFSHPCELPLKSVQTTLTIHRVLTSISKYWGDFWDEELSGRHPKIFRFRKFHGVVDRRIILYEEELKNIMDGLKHTRHIHQ